MFEGLGILSFLLSITGFAILVFFRNLASEENDTNVGVCAFPNAFVSYFGMQSSESRA